MFEEIKTDRDLKLVVEKEESDGFIKISIAIKTSKKCLLHWGFSRRDSSPWEMPPRSFWPEGSTSFWDAALRTPFICRKDECRVVIKVDKAFHLPIIKFSLFFPEENFWENNGGRNYQIALPLSDKPFLSPEQILKREMKKEEPCFEETVDLDEDSQIAMAVVKEGHFYRISIITDIAGPLILHWGVAIKTPYEWSQPSDSLLPEGTALFEDLAAQTPFLSQGGLNRLSWDIREEEAPLSISFVLKQTDTDRWLKKHGHHFTIPLVTLFHEKWSLEAPGISGAMEEIIRAETGRNSWTLMHRFNLCHDLLESVGNSMEGLALLFVWMRFSAIRQLDWQRNYNTQPKELSHAQDRLTLKLAETYIHSDKDEREFVRLILATLGRGGEGQRIRDDILHIMHRHKMKEVSGHFMEEWHQKLHNNTTPDDVVICEAYLEFLKSDGNLSRFYETLKAGGVTRERLENFERPIVTQPDFVPHLKWGLTHDFENYLKLLKLVHSGTDLGTAIRGARYLFDEETGQFLDFILHYQSDPAMPVVDLMGKTVESRRRLKGLLEREREKGRVRDLLYLEQALEEFSRVVVERNIHSLLEGDQLVDLIGMALDNLRLSYDDGELSASSRQWERLKGTPRFSRDWTLHAKSVSDRLGRVMGTIIDHYYVLLQSRAETLGQAFYADSWTIALFSEEIVRGRPAFILSMLLRHLDPLLRKAANLGHWQVVSWGQGTGRVEVVDALSVVQGRRFDSPTVIVADKIKGDEEIPEGVTAVITPDATDVVSHVAVRARNVRLLFATCYDVKTVDHLKSLQDHFLNLHVSAAGDVIIEEGEGKGKIEPVTRKPLSVKRTKPEFTDYVISEKDFSDLRVGGKSNNLKCLQGKLPDWIHLPASAALPFGIFEKILFQSQNKGISERCRGLAGRMKNKEKENLAELREVLMDLAPPEDLVASFRRVLNTTDLDGTVNWEDAWECIKRVWASKWNERAYLSRQSIGIPHQDLTMAVLIQQVVEAEFAFVIHTVNPVTGDDNEIYAEVVLGLGETLVGNFPGRAMSFSSKKKSQCPRLLSYPGKSLGLYGGGLIFRSDSNGEDLAGFAGAGLYDSFMLEPPQEVLLDYSKERLVWDEDFRKDFLFHIAQIGVEVENVMGCPQDIEGVYTKGKYYVVQTRPQVGLEGT